MAKVNTQSKILSIEEQIKQLQEKKKKEISKLESAVGKKFIEVFEVQNLSAQDIYKFIETLKVNYSSSEIDSTVDDKENENASTNKKDEDLQ